jgi:hypothetical protein
MEELRSIKIIRKINNVYELAQAVASQYKLKPFPQEWKC